MRARYAAAFGLVMACSILDAPVRASQPAVLTATFKDRDLRDHQTVQPVSTPACRVAFTEIVDERTTPALVGVIGKRAVHAPADSQAWMRAVLSGLASRGVTPVFDRSEQAPVQVRFSLRTAWIDASVETYTASVVVAAKANSGDQTPEKSYRGRAARSAYWSGGSDTMQSVVDGAFADMLNKLAPDLKLLCAAGHS